jgi:hypothetical protein
MYKASPKHQRQSTQRNFHKNRRRFLVLRRNQADVQAGDMEMNILWRLVTVHSSSAYPTSSQRDL